MQDQGVIYYLKIIPYQTMININKEIFLETYGCQMDAKKDDYGENSYGIGRTRNNFKIN